MEAKRLPVLASQDACSGCMACGEVCPKDCVSFKMGKDGFWYPQIENESCIGCHSCERVCPVITPISHDVNHPPKVYAAWTVKDARHNSASGGVFFAIAESVIQAGGYVAGAIFEGKTVKHILTNKIDELKLIQGTKYFQSYTCGIYKQIKKLLIEGNTVLFGGTSCQVAGLLNVVGEKQDNLITIDLICYGVPSALTIEVEERIRRKKLKRIISNRDKNHDGGWRDSYYMTCEWEDGTITVSPQKDSFMLSSFCSGKVMRNSCYCCPYKTIYRQADLTIGDYHCVKDFEEQKKEGISLVYVNSGKGESAFKNGDSLIVHEREIQESLPFKRTIFYNDTMQGRRFERIWMQQILRYAPCWMLKYLYQANLKSLNPLVWPLMAIDILYYIKNNRKIKKDINSINKKLQKYKSQV